MTAAVARLAYDASGTPVGTVGSMEPVEAVPIGAEVVVPVVPEQGRGGT